MEMLNFTYMCRNFRLGCRYINLAYHQWKSNSTTAFYAFWYFVSKDDHQSTIIEIDEEENFFLTTKRNGGLKKIILTKYPLSESQIDTMIEKSSIFYEMAQRYKRSLRTR